MIPRMTRLPANGIELEYDVFGDPTGRPLQLVSHGEADPLIPVEPGIDTHRCVAGSKLLRLEGMGHDPSRPLWPRLVDAMSDFTERHSPQ